MNIRRTTTSSFLFLQRNPEQMPMEQLMMTRICSLHLPLVAALHLSMVGPRRKSRLPLERQFQLRQPLGRQLMQLSLSLLATVALPFPLLVARRDWIDIPATTLPSCRDWERNWYLVWRAPALVLEPLDCHGVAVMLWEILEGLGTNWYLVWRVPHNVALVLEPLDCY